MEYGVHRVVEEQHISLPCPELSPAQTEEVDNRLRQPSALSAKRKPVEVLPTGVDANGKTNKVGIHPPKRRTLVLQNDGSFAEQLETPPLPVPASAPVAAEPLVRLLKRAMNFLSHQVMPRKHMKSR